MRFKSVPLKEVAPMNYPSISDEELDSMQARCDKATQGPWVSYIEGRDHYCGSNFIMTDGEDFELLGATVHDQDFIAHARQDIPRLIAEIGRLKKMLSQKLEQH